MRDAGGRGGSAARRRDVAMRRAAGCSVQFGGKVPMIFERRSAEEVTGEPSNTKWNIPWNLHRIFHSYGDEGLTILNVLASSEY